MHTVGGETWSRDFRLRDLQRVQEGFKVYWHTHTHTSDLNHLITDQSRNTGVTDYLQLLAVNVGWPAPPSGGAPRMYTVSEGHTEVSDRSSLHI